MEAARARVLLDRERRRLRQLSDGETPEGGDERQAELTFGDEEAELDVEQMTGEALTEQVRERQAALDRAEARLAAGTFGRSVRSGAVIPDDRLEADPLAELTVEEQAEEDRLG